MALYKAFGDRHRSQGALLVQRAVRTEDYSAAASLRDSIRQVQAADPVLRLKGELEDAIEAQNFEASRPSATLVF